MRAKQRKNAPRRRKTAHFRAIAESSPEAGPALTQSSSRRPRPLAARVNLAVDGQYTAPRDDRTLERIQIEDGQKAWNCSYFRPRCARVWARMLSTSSPDARRVSLMVIDA
jgi:hypothetical protein